MCFYAVWAKTLDRRIDKGVLKFWGRWEPGGELIMQWQATPQLHHLLMIFLEEHVRRKSKEEEGWGVVSWWYDMYGMRAGTLLWGGCWHRQRCGCAVKYGHGCCPHDEWWINFGCSSRHILPTVKEGPGCEILIALARGQHVIQYDASTKWNCKDGWDWKAAYSRVTHPTM